MKNRILTGESQHWFVADAAERISALITPQTKYARTRSETESVREKRSMGSDDTHCQSRVSDLDESGDVCAGNVVAWLVIFVCSRGAVVVDVLHDRL